MILYYRIFACFPHIIWFTSVTSGLFVHSKNLSFQEPLPKFLKVNLVSRPISNWKYTEYVLNISKVYNIEINIEVPKNHMCCWQEYYSLNILSLWRVFAK